MKSNTIKYIRLNFVDLESEMYQLSHLLIEQSNILSTLREQNSIDDGKGGLMNDNNDGMLNIVKNCIKIEFLIYFLNPIFIDTMTKDEAHNKRAIAAIEASLIGFTGSLENKTFLHEGALIELDPESYRPICRVYFFLLNDLLIVGKVKHEK